MPAAHDRSIHDLSRQCLCDTKLEPQPIPREGLQFSFWANQGFGQNMLLSTTSLPHCPSVQTTFLIFLITWDSPLVWQIINSMSVLDWFPHLCGPFPYCGSHSTYPCGQWIITPFPGCNLNSLCVVIIGVFPKPLGEGQGLVYLPTCSEGLYSNMSGHLLF